MDLNSFYSSINEDLGETLSRLGSEKLLSRILEKFKSDTTLETLEKALAGKDGAAAFMAVHTLKGVALNLGFSKLAEKSSQLTELLRPCCAAGSVPAVFSEELQKKSSELIAAVKEEYGKIKAAY